VNIVKILNFKSSGSERCGSPGAEAYTTWIKGQSFLITARIPKRAGPCDQVQPPGYESKSLGKYRLTACSTFLNQL
jgi:hypothetical protein